MFTLSGLRFARSICVRSFPAHIWKSGDTGVLLCNSKVFLVFLNFLAAGTTTPQLGWQLVHVFDLPPLDADSAIHGCLAFSCGALPVGGR